MPATLLLPRNANNELSGPPGEEPRIRGGARGWADGRGAKRLGSVEQKSLDYHRVVRGRAGQWDTESRKDTEQLLPLFLLTTTHWPLFTLPA